jgi:hypothetical protein
MVHIKFGLQEILVEMILLSDLMLHLVLLDYIYYIKNIKYNNDIANVNDDIANGRINFYITHIDLGSYAAGAEKFDQTTTIKAADVYPGAHGIGIVGWNLSGSGYTKCILSRLGLDGSSTGPWVLYWSLCNVGSASTGNITLSLTIPYVYY